MLIGNAAVLRILEKNFARSITWPPMDRSNSRLLQEKGLFFLPAFAEGFPHSCANQSTTGFAGVGRQNKADFSNGRGELVRLRNNFPIWRPPLAFD